MVLDLDGEDFDILDYPSRGGTSTQPLTCANAWLGTKVAEWGVFVVTVTGRPQIYHPMIDPDSLIRHAEQLADTVVETARPDAALRRRISSCLPSGLS